MHWVTREYLHLDRVAAPWLILRFVDQDARFSTVPWGKEHLAPPGAIPLALPGAELAPHDADGCTFERVITKYGIEDPAIDRLAKVIRNGIAFVLEGYRPGADDLDGQIAVGLVTIAEGILTTRRTDPEVLQASLPVYDALYGLFSVTSYIERNAISLDRKGRDGRGPSNLVETMRGIHSILPASPHVVVAKKQSTA